MKKGCRAVIMLAFLALAACGQGNGNGSQPGDDIGSQNAPLTGAAAGKVHAATGDITAIEGDKVTISHGPIASAGWPAMTMTFRAPTAQAIQGLGVGDPVSFQFRQSGGSYELTSIRRAPQ